MLDGFAMVRHWPHLTQMDVLRVLILVNSCHPEVSDDLYKHLPPSLEHLTIRHGVPRSNGFVQALTGLSSVVLYGDTAETSKGERRKWPNERFPAKMQCTRLEQVEMVFPNLNHSFVDELCLHAPKLRALVLSTRPNHRYESYGKAPNAVFRWRGCLPVSNKQEAQLFSREHEAPRLKVPWEYFVF